MAVIVLYLTLDTCTYLYALEKAIACRVSKCQDAPDGPVGDSGPRMAYAIWTNGPPPPKKYAAYHTVWSETFIDM